ncbi:hypothetical protein [Secundilactobacillus yichangensis]|uniref:hypothetical protein n=1 Tax=Secundilactobacillus yichangensis TaxID=2799580 RepID=UPI001944F1CD|nr:hypothetical protein [Secundilactobacillus yichangensis]
MENKNKSQTILASVISYRLNNLTLDQDFKLLMIKLDNKIRLGKFQKLLRSCSVQAVTGYQLKYLVLLNKETDWPVLEGMLVTQIRFSTISENGVYPNQILQLLLNQQTLDAGKVSKESYTNGLYVSRKDMKHTLRDGREQRIALNITANWEHDLEMKTTTFTEKLNPQASDELYYWNQTFNRMERSQIGSTHKLYKKENIYNEKNNIKFVSFEELTKFEQSKVGIVQEIKAAINKNMSSYLIAEMNFRQFPLVKYSHPKLPQKEDIWQLLKGQSINIYFDVSEPLTGALANEIVNSLKHSATLKSLQIQVNLSQSAKSGLNIQVVRDARNNDGVKEAYEVGTAEQIIQHITVENFGQMNSKSQTFKWRSTGISDVAGDNKVIKLIQELIVKQDIVHEYMRPVTNQLVYLTGKYQFYKIDWLDKRQTQVMITKLWVEETNQLKFKSQTVDVNNLVADDEFTEIARGILSVVHRKKKKSIWDTVECVIKCQSGFVIIQQTPRQTMISLDEIAEKMAVSDPNKKIRRSTMMTELENLRKSHESEFDYQEAVDKMLMVIGQLGVTPQLGQTKSVLKGKGVNFKTGKVQQINQELEQQGEFAFGNTVRQKRNAAQVLGLHGIGLVNIDGKYHYFVGTDKGLRPSLVRAYRLRRLIPITGDGSQIPDLFEDLLAMMDVEFVRNGQYTVLPFPVKYLREYQEYQKRLAARK